ncbi:hypothetical protein SAICODRAFT_24718 [Saitoella complicata NRRL Y-17804]|uniref:BIR-domain-containing protein n=1 Tax=Saitoella complicata (strain BCRC 22490 / CBS 7301 / JCM 7358 / NBRC 10748 / NRRL Y-17804) TaxID=698492 RepID=A0A0E9NBR1_SAICN|nr:uncharacterized protein SAICODRAFT_24718 [Saitoella complicata NRRL Y-17804]ODQ53947.1 hypothetical protein SAICODRAFT_24718 [Saitoella complicata NRRL Y-17804]GAO46835.1 hypothetical protein G7K_1053-t1 [Saitoella complicata NRRL Y-17804]
MEILSNRLQTFAPSGTGKKKKTGWPHSLPTTKSMASAGFFFHPTSAGSDEVQCFLCAKPLDGWDPTDDPLFEHLSHSRKCGWALNRIIRSLIETSRTHECLDPQSLEMLKARKETFGKWWPHEEKRAWVGTSGRMAEAGFYFTPTGESEDMVTCAYCGLGLDGWERADDPVAEHQRRTPSCPFFIGFNPTPSREGSLEPTKNKRRASSVAAASTRDDSDNESVMSIQSTASTRGSKKKKPAKEKKSKTKDKVPELEGTVFLEDDVSSIASTTLKTARRTSSRPSTTAGKKRASVAADDFDLYEEAKVEEPPRKRRASSRAGSIGPEAVKGRRQSTGGKAAVGSEEPVRSERIVEETEDEEMEPEPVKRRQSSRGVKIAQGVSSEEVEVVSEPVIEEEAEPEPENEPEQKPEPEPVVMNSVPAPAPKRRTTRSRDSILYAGESEGEPVPAPLQAPKEKETKAKTAKKGGSGRAGSMMSVDEESVAVEKELKKKGRGKKKKEEASVPVVTQGFELMVEVDEMERDEPAAEPELVVVKGERESIYGLQPSMGLASVVEEEEPEEEPWGGIKIERVSLDLVGMVPVSQIPPHTEEAREEEMHEVKEDEGPNWEVDEASPEQEAELEMEVEVGEVIQDEVEVGEQSEIIMSPAKKKRGGRILESSDAEGTPVKHQQPLGKAPVLAPSTEPVSSPTSGAEPKPEPVPLVSPVAALTLTHISQDLIPFPKDASSALTPAELDLTVEEWNRRLTEGGVEALERECEEMVQGLEQEGKKAVERVREWPSVVEE